MSQQNGYLLVGQVAEIFHLSVRTLHHWEAIGLMRPEERNRSNFRLYSQQDCQRISRILIYRATGMKLAGIKQLLDSGESPVEHLKRQRAVLRAQHTQLRAMICAVDELLDKEMNNNTLTPEEIGQILGDAGYAPLRAEAEQAFGASGDWKIFAQRTSGWDAADYRENKARFDEVDAALARAVREGIAPDSQRAADLVAEHAAVIGEFFPVTPAKHYLISRGYVADERFRNYYDSRQEGFARWLADAIEHHARACGVDVANPSWD